MQRVRHSHGRMALRTTHLTGSCPAWLEPQTAAARRRRSSAVASASTGSRLSGDARPFGDLPGPGGPPYFGTYFQYKLGMVNTDKLFDVLTGWHKQYGAIFKEVCLGNTTVHVADPQAFRTVYASDGKRPRIEPLSEPTMRYRQGERHFTGPGKYNDEEWYQLRSAAQQLMMRPKELVPFLPAADQVARDFVSQLKGVRDASQEVPDFATELGRWALESSGVHCFSRRLGYLTEEGRGEAEQLLAASTLQFELMKALFASLPVYQSTRLPTPKWRRLFSAEDHMYSVFLKHLKAALDQLKAKIAHGDFEDDLEDREGFRFLRYMVSKELSPNDVAIITHSLLFDPLSTVTPQLQFLLYLLSTNPRAQDRLYQEIQSVAPPSASSCLTSDGVRRMSYFRACFKESSRLMPMTNENKRYLRKDLVLGGFHIPANTLVHLNPFALYRDPHHFSDPDHFVPERWLQEKSEQKMDPSIVQPFGVGPRMCIGRRFAEQDMAVLLSRLLQTFRLEWHHPPHGREAPRPQPTRLSRPLHLSSPLNADPTCAPSPYLPAWLIFVIVRRY